MTKIQQLKNLIKHYDDLYYNQNKSAISDQEYDNLKRQLLKLSSGEVGVGAKSASGLPKIIHESRIMSLDNIFNEDELDKFISKVKKTLIKEAEDDFNEVFSQDASSKKQKDINIKVEDNSACMVKSLEQDSIREGNDLQSNLKGSAINQNNSLSTRFGQKIEFISEPKVDGLTIVLKYKNYKLESASTRGDGIEGEDVTENIKNIGIPGEFKIKSPEFKNIEIMGEVYLNESDFIKLNNELSKKTLFGVEEKFSTSRHAASASLRQINPFISQSRPLKYVIHGFQFEGNMSDWILSGSSNCKSIDIVNDFEQEKVLQASEEEKNKSFEGKLHKDLLKRNDHESHLTQNNDIKNLNNIYNLANEMEPYPNIEWSETLFHRFISENKELNFNNLNKSTRSLNPLCNQSQKNHENKKANQDYANTAIDKMHTDEFDALYEKNMTSHSSSLENFKIQDSCKLKHFELKNNGDARPENNKNNSRVEVQYSNVMDFLKENGFSIFDYHILSEDSIQSDCEEYIKKRSEYEYNIDGVVYKVNDLRKQKILGFTNHAPRYAFAYKFKSMSALTKVLGIDFQVGRTGNITPVAILEPIRIQNVTIKRVTLHNTSELVKKNIVEGDVVTIERSGDVIPKIIGVKKESDKKLVIIKHCPSCKSTLELKNNILRCINGLKCHEQKIAWLENFVSRSAFNITALGKKNILVLNKMGYLDSLEDFFEIKKHKKDLLKIRGWGGVFVDKLLSAISKSQSIKREKFINSLGIPLVGKSTSKILAEIFFDDDLEEKILMIKGLGEKIIHEVLSYKKKNKLMIDKLIAEVTFID